jgi:c(7)-type cytochrome triheme protein
VRRILALLLIGLGVVGCGNAARALFDLPAPRAAAPPAATMPGRAAPRDVAGAPLPVLETTLDPDSVLTMLPRDSIGHADWVAALRMGLMRPRPAIGGRFEDSPTPFGFDFFLAGKDTSFDVSFPHSVHTQIIACAQCHGRLFRYRNVRYQMQDLLEGRYCGECHGKVSFPLVSGCERCHTRILLPAHRTRARLLGTVQMARVTDGSGMSPSTPEQQLPPALFPHWVHRIRYQCRTCHMDLFEPRAGANRITMRDITAGRACGRCHDGETAFRAGFGNCQRCHTKPTVPPPDSSIVDTLLQER